jgi:hypothetical protein
MDDGVRVAVDVQALISEVRISPLMPSWFSEVASAVVEQWDLKLPVHHSQLSDTPFY